MTFRAISALAFVFAISTSAVPPLHAQSDTPPAAAECKRLGNPSALVKNCTALISANPGRADYLAIRGSAYLVLGDHEAASKDIEAALAIDPDNLLALSRRVRLSIGDDDKEPSNADITHILALKPKTAGDFEARGLTEMIRRNLAEARTQPGRYALAIKDYSSGLELDPTNITLLYERSYAYGQSNNLTAATEDAEKAVATNPQSALAYLALANSLLALLRPDDAIKAFGRAVELDPQWVRSRFLRGAAYLAKGDYANARLDADKAIELNPRGEAPWLLRASVNFAQSEPGKAFEDLDEALKAGKGKAASYPAVLRSNEIFGKDPLLRRIYEASKKIEKRPLDGPSYLDRGKAFIEIKEYRRAWVDLDMAAQLIATNAGVFQQRALVLDALGFKDKAAEDRLKAAAILSSKGTSNTQPAHKPGETDLASKALVSIDLAAVIENINKHQLDAAMNTLNKLLASQPKNWQALALRGQVHIEKKEFAEALADMSASLDVKPDSAETHVMRGAIYVWTGKPQLAVQDCDKAVALKPFDPWPHICRARISYAQKSYESAISEYTAALNFAPPKTNPTGKVIISEARWGRAASYYFNRQLPEAAEDARALLAIKPDSAPGIRLLRLLTEPEADAKPMTVRIVRSAETGCGDQCPEWISAEGKINASTLSQFRNVFRKMGSRKLPVFVDSPGGLTHEGMAVGREIRAHGLDVYVTQTEPADCPGPQERCRKAKAEGVAFATPRGKFAQCASACVFLLAAGTTRAAGASAIVGVHRSGYFGRDGKPLDREVPPVEYDRMRAYFAEMGVDTNVMVKLQATPFKSMYWLPRSELQGLRLVTEVRSGEELVDGEERDGFEAPRGSISSNAKNAPPTPVH